MNPDVTFSIPSLLSSDDWSGLSSGPFAPVPGGTAINTAVSGDISTSWDTFLESLKGTGAAILTNALSGAAAGVRSGSVQQRPVQQATPTATRGQVSILLVLAVAGAAIFFVGKRRGR